ncbi:isocitrate/isopropylmalate dehydrogenase family protein [Saccharopolyspora dendranthemae]|uniref:3-isopropylmalate dehydrogenase n=1 Tax=Saccharopolyspora dendranthemae TaxID=1181886 RepID=A0A561U4L9_9PSEU|nr:isocitrate/isopropylmalate family dehydrogenase [Saccharopolyspora dendranthemae]TWF94296.1 3-isopropylmalate dehydrogenase [Saccharopolyspora dendranthemae]
MRIACIDGDGIGPELMASAREVLGAAAELDGLAVEFGAEAGGAGTYLETGEPLAAGAVERFRGEYDAVLKGPVGLPEVRKADGTEAGVLGGVLRNGLDTYANVRPVRLLPGVRDAADPIDYVVVRENTEGLYLSRGSGVRNERAASDQLLMTRVGVERIVRFAFETARTRNGAPVDGVQRVTCVDKSNVLRSFAFFRDIFDEIAADYPDVEADHRYTDAAAHDLVAVPGHFDVLVTENFVGDMLSDLGAATVGGLGMCPSGNIGETTAYFEPVHGSAPSIAGQDKANPTSQLLTAAMLLDHVGAADTAARITRAVESAYADRAVELNPDGTPGCGTKGVTAAVLTRLR